MKVINIIVVIDLNRRDISTDFTHKSTIMPSKAATSFVNFFISLDGYGEPVSVSYKGSSTYQTHLGALFTVAMRGFMLVFTVMGTLELLDFQNPTVSQYTVYDDRIDSPEVNLGEALGDLFFGFVDNKSNSFVLDRKVATIKMQAVRIDWSKGPSALSDLDVVEELDQVSVSQATYPFLYESGGAVTKFNTDGLFAIKTPNAVTLKNDYMAEESLFLRF